MKMWTSEQVKAELPDVPVIVTLNGKRYKVPGQVRGRENTFATVFTRERHAEFAWAAIAYALNSGNALRMS